MDESLCERINMSNRNNVIKGPWGSVVELSNENKVVEQLTYMKETLEKTLNYANNDTLIENSDMLRLQLGVLKVKILWIEDFLCEIGHG